MKSYHVKNESKILGIIFNNQGVSNRNLNNVEEKLEKKLRLWNTIGLSLIERVTVVRTFGLSMLWFVLRFIILNKNEI